MRNMRNIGYQDKPSRARKEKWRKAERSSTIEIARGRSEQANFQEMCKYLELFLERRVEFGRIDEQQNQKEIIASKAEAANQAGEQRKARLCKMRRGEVKLASSRKQGERLKVKDSKEERA